MGTSGIFFKDLSCSMPNGTFCVAGQRAESNELGIRELDSDPCPATNLLFRRA